MKKETIQLSVAGVVLAALAVAIVVLMRDMDAHSLFVWYKDHLGYGMIFLLMAVESSFVPFPSEIVVPPAAYFAVKNGDMNIALIVLVATAGALLGAVINYLLALWLGRPVMYSFANSRIGHICLIDEAKVQKAETYFAEHGAISTLLGRLIPAVRQLISIPAGLARMKFGKFVLFTSLGAGIWNAVLACLGWWLSTVFPEDRLFEALEQNNRYLTWAGFALLGVIIAYLAYRGLKGNNAKAETGKTDE